MPRVSVTLPEYLKEFVAAEVTEKGFASAGEYLGLLVLGAYQQEHRDRIGLLLLEGLNSGPSTPMTAEDWKDLRLRIAERLDKDKKKPKRKRT
jgi:antitoxin ParD1/3/4